MRHYLEEHFCVLWYLKHYTCKKVKVMYLVLTMTNQVPSIKNQTLFLTIIIIYQYTNEIPVQVRVCNKQRLIP